MRKRRERLALLVRYFFQRFFENDVLDSAGETLTTVVRALATTAVPGLMIAFFLQNQYPRRAPWGRVEDHYFFGVYSFVVMAGVAIFEWEMLFPDRLDFLVLSHLPLRKLELLRAKLAALGGFLAIFLFAANVFGCVMLPAVSKEDFWRQLLSQAAAVVGAGCFGALAILAAGGCLLCVFPERVFRVVSPVLRALVVAALVLVLVHAFRCGDHLDVLLRSPLGAARCLPTFWFLGVYEKLFRGSAAPAFAQPMAALALRATAIAFLLVCVTYPFAWARVRKMTLESGAAPGRRARTGSMGDSSWLSHSLPLRAEQRAVFAFIGNTLARGGRYQVYLSTYLGVGLALAIACAVALVLQGDRYSVRLSHRGLYAMVPLLLFWTVAGLRLAFALPIHLRARWVFRLTAAPREACIAAGRIWAGACSVAVLFALLLVQWRLGLTARELLVQAVCGLCACSVLVDGLLFADGGIPFAQPRSPGSISLPLTLTLFVGALPLGCLGMVSLESWLNLHPGYLLLGVLVIPGVHAIAGKMRGWMQPVLEDGDEVEEEFQLLRLTAD